MGEDILNTENDQSVVEADTPDDVDVSNQTEEAVLDENTSGKNTNTNGVHAPNIDQNNNSLTPPLPPKKNR